MLCSSRSSGRRRGRRGGGRISVFLPVPPHRHVTPPKSEAFIPLTGAVGVVLFDDAGAVTAAHRLDAAGPVRGIDLPPGVWHTVIAVTEASVCYEVKPGPWEPASDKDFAA
jgi:cupin fold WbuC family metalloprotein